MWTLILAQALTGALAAPTPDHASTHTHRLVARMPPRPTPVEVTQLLDELRVETTGADPMRIEAWSSNHLEWSTCDDQIGLASELAGEPTLTILATSAWETHHVALTSTPSSRVAAARWDGRCVLGVLEQSGRLTLRTASGDALALERAADPITDPAELPYGALLMGTPEGFWVGGDARHITHVSPRGQGPRHELDAAATAAAVLSVDGQRAWVISRAGTLYLVSRDATPPRALTRSAPTDTGVVAWDRDRLVWVTRAGVIYQWDGESRTRLADLGAAPDATPLVTGRDATLELLVPLRDGTLARL